MIMPDSKKFTYLAIIRHGTVLEPEKLTRCAQPPIDAAFNQENKTLICIKRLRR